MFREYVPRTNRSPNLPEVGSDLVAEAAVGHAAVGGEPASRRAHASAWRPVPVRTGVFVSQRLWLCGCVIV